MMNESELRSYLMECHIDDDVAGLLEEYHDKYKKGPADGPLFERFLGSERLSVRREALSGLIYSARQTGYEADALSLFYSGEMLESFPEFDRFEERDHAFPESGLSFLRELKKRGSPIAARILLTLVKSKRLRDCYCELLDVWDGEAD